MSHRRLYHPQLRKLWDRELTRADARCARRTNRRAAARALRQLLREEVAWRTSCMSSITLSASRDQGLYATVTPTKDGTIVRFCRRHLWCRTLKRPVPKLLAEVLIDDQPFHVVRDRVHDLLRDLA